MLKIMSEENAQLRAELEHLRAKFAEQPTSPAHGDNSLVFPKRAPFPVSPLSIVAVLPLIVFRSSLQSRHRI